MRKTSRKPRHAIDVQRFTDALAIEGRARKRLLRLSEALKAVYNDGRKPTEDNLKKLHRSVRRWIKTAKTVANVIGEQFPEDQ
jgi:hypothetical protein